LQVLSHNCISKLIACHFMAAFLASHEQHLHPLPDGCSCSDPTVPLHWTKASVSGATLWLLWLSSSGTAVHSLRCCHRAAGADAANGLSQLAGVAILGGGSRCAVLDGSQR
jgi:hypothetical protein